MDNIKFLKQLSAGMCAIFLVACGGNSLKPQQNVENTFSAEFLAGVETYEVTATAVKREIKLTGKVDYDADKIVRYISFAGGAVQSTSFNTGDRVQKGQVMAVIRSAELSAMQAEKQNLEAEIKVLQRDLESMQGMYKDELVSQKELFETQSRLKQAEIEMEKVKINLSLYGSSGSDGAFLIRAPISGFVVNKNIAPGSQIAAESEPLFVIADLSKVWIMANVYAGDLAFVKQGMSVDIRALSWHNEVFHGRIDAVSQVFDAEEHVLKARIVMPNAEMKFRPEMAVDLTLKLSEDTEMATVPTKAIIFDDNKHFAVLKQGDGFNIREVRLHSRNGDTTYLSSGLERGEQIVIKNQLLMYGKLKDGIKLK
jgi:cobalt-zinc-cadmium efflux system membrane fusion protein